MDLKGLFDSLYNRFLLLDFFAKIVPGLLLMAAITVTASSWSFLFCQLKGMNGWMWLAVAGIAWLTGVGIQGLGERRDVTKGLIRELPPEVDRTQYWNQDLNLAWNAPEHVRQTTARSAVIKEATGIGALSLSLSVFLVVLDSAVERHVLIVPLRNLAPVLGIVLVCVGLWLFHRRAIEREFAYRNHHQN